MRNSFLFIIIILFIFCTFAKGYDLYINMEESSELKFREQKILASDGAPDDEFGFSVSIDGDYAIVGARWDDDNGSYSGSAYIYQFNDTEWVQQTKILPSDGASNDSFGFSVSIDGDYVVVGALFDNDKGNYSGSAYIFHRVDSEWIQQSKLLASDGASIDLFGISVSISGDYAIVGAVNDDDKGAAYLFRRYGSIWIQQTKLTASPRKYGDYFGVSVSLDENYAVVGANFNDDGGYNAGSAYVFCRSGSTWIQQTKLIAGDSASEDLFGTSVSIDNDNIVVGAPYNDDNRINSGTAYIFCRDGLAWIQKTKLIASDGALGDRFGSAVSIESDDVIVGSPGDNSGATYLFCQSDSEWSQRVKIKASDGSYADYFGDSVDISSGVVIAGARKDDDKGNSSGSAYIFRKNKRPIANAGADQLVYAFVDGYALVKLDGTGSYDEDGDALEYFWYTDAGDLIATEVDPNVLFSAGEYVIDLIVNDGIEDSEPNSCVITVIDALETEAKIFPHSLNWNSNRPYVIGRLKLISFSETDIDPNEPMVLMPGNIEAKRVDILPSNDSAHSITLMGFFDNGALMNALEQDGVVEISIGVRLLTGQWVYGVDIVKVK